MRYAGLDLVQFKSDWNKFTNSKKLNWAKLKATYEKNTDSKNIKQKPSTWNKATHERKQFDKKEKKHHKFNPMMQLGIHHHERQAKKNIPRAQNGVTWSLIPGRWRNRKYRAKKGKAIKMTLNRHITKKTIQGNSTQSIGHTGPFQPRQVRLLWEGIHLAGTPGQGGGQVLCQSGWRTEIGTETLPPLTSLFPKGEKEVILVLMSGSFKFIMQKKDQTQRRVMKIPMETPQTPTTITSNMWTSGPKCWRKWPLNYLLRKIRSKVTKILTYSSHIFTSKTRNLEYRNSSDNGHEQ